MKQLLLIMSFFLSLSLHATAQADDKPPEVSSPVVNKLDDGVYSIFFMFVNSLVVIGDNDVLVTDTSFTPRAEILKQEISKLTEKPVSKIVMSHEHYDHVGGTEVFEGAEVICHVNCAKIFQLDVFGITPKTIHQTFNDTLSIDLGGKTVELYHWGPGDGVATTVVYLPQEKVVATADLYEPQELTNGMFLDDVNMLGVRRILNNIAQLEVSHAVNAHSIDTDPRDLKENIEYINDLYEAVYTELNKIMQTQGMVGAYGAVGTLPGQIELPGYSGWKNYDHLHHHARRMMYALFHGG